MTDKDQSPITLAEKETWQKEFANEATYQSAAERYSKLAVKFPVKSQVINPGKQHADTANRQDQIDQFVNEAMTGPERLTYDQAWSRMRKVKPELLAGMQEPAQAVKGSKHTV